MGVSFVETMQGELTDLEGKRHPIRFDVQAEATHLRHFARTGIARLTGVVQAEPWVEHAVLEGTITLRLLVGRTIAYDFSFVDEEERVYRFRGQKKLSLRRPVFSATFLAGELSCEGEVVARGTLAFDLHELLTFSLSWLTRPTQVRSDLGKVTVDGGVLEPPLSPRRVRALRAFAEAAILPGPNIPPVDEQTVEEAIRFVGHMPQPLRKAYGIGLDALNVLSRTRTGRSFASLSLERRRAIVEAVAHGRLEAPAILLYTLAMPIKSAHFRREDYRIAVGAPDYLHEVREPEPDYLQAVTPIDALEVDSAIEADVIVVGTGAGGATIAAELAEQGLVVVVVEAGAYKQRADFSGDPMQRGVELWRDRGLTFTVGNCTATLPTGKLVGGTTAINSGTCFHTPDAVLQEWREEGLSADFSPETFNPLFDRVDEELRVQPGDARYLGRIAHTIGRGADCMGFGHGPLMRNAEGCDGQGTCIYGCPTDAKRSTNVSWMPRALRSGAFLYTGLRVSRLLMQGRQVVGVLASGTDSGGLTKRLRLSARAVVLSTGSLVTPALLQDNGFRLPQLGRNLSIHPGFGMYARMASDGTPWKAIPQGYGFHGHGLEGVRFEGFYLPPQMAGITLPAIGKELSTWMEHPARVDQFGFMVRDRNNGRVLRSPGGGVVVHKSLERRTVERLRGGASLLAEVLLHGGAEEVLSCVGRTPSIKTVDEARALGRRRVSARDFTVLGAHPLGTCRIATSPKTGCLDMEHRVFGTDNLYVVDGSAVPTSLGVNPQVTIMAMALRAGAGIADRLA